jgi:hypothetical protein
MVDTKLTGKPRDYLDAAKRAAESKRWEAAIAASLICLAELFLVEEEQYEGYPAGYPELGG